MTHAEHFFFSEEEYIKKGQSLKMAEQELNQVTFQLLHTQLSNCVEWLSNQPETEANNKVAFRCYALISAMEDPRFELSIKE